MNNSINQIPFTPVKGKEAQIKKLNPQQDGFVYFSTDTKKIFMSQNKELLTMGGNSSIYYGSRPMAEHEIYGDSTDFDFLGYVKDLEEVELFPQVDDLILNEPDGGFYRIVISTPEKIIGRRIAVSGTGGGGGGTGGGGGGTTGQEVFKLDILGKRQFTILKTDTCVLRYRITAKDADGLEVFDDAEATWLIEGKEYKQKIKPNQEGSFQVDQYLQAGKENSVYLTVKMSLDGSDNVKTVSKKWEITVVNLDLEWNYTYSINSYISGEDFPISWTPKGGIDCITHLNFYNSENVKILSKEIAVPASKTNQRNTVTLSTLDASGNVIFNYGVYTCEMYVTAVVNDETKTTPTIYNELTFIKDGASDILTIPFYTTECRQYDTLSIPFMIYNPNKEKCLVKFFLKDNSTGNYLLIGKDEYERGLQYWPYTVTTSGRTILRIEAENESIYKEFEINVKPLDIDVEEVSGAVFSLKASNFSTNEQIKSWTIKGQPGLSFSENFDWNIGGLKFRTLENGAIEKYIKIPVGTTMTVNYYPYSNDSNSILGNGKNLKICFKASNCYDYNAKVMECYDPSTQLGIKMTAQQTTFHLQSGAIRDTQYCENSYIELEHEIYPLEDPEYTSQKHRAPDTFLFYWVDGIPVSVAVYPSTETFKQATPQKMVFGSNECDIEIYSIKAYDRYLTEEEHLQNFIADAPTPQEMLDRYHRNDILVDGHIDPEKLVQKNPKCHAYIYEIDRMTEHKDDKVGGCDYIELYGENNTFNNPYYKAINTGKGAQIRVQGTSSSAYGVAAFNLRTKFQEGLLKQGNEEKVNWKVSDNAIPIDYTCTKVNVASCENANNVVNQEWYNRFQPYWDTNRRGGGRDTMEFNSGVVFIKDNNKNGNILDDDKAPSEALFKKANVFNDVEGYIANPYFRQYAIGNMGNDKKNVEVFHDLTNPKVCCVENTDNQLPLQFMIEEVEESTDFKKSAAWNAQTVIVDGEEVEITPFEFRYPDEGEGQVTLEHRHSFERLINWMARNNPINATNEPLEKEKVWGPYTFKGQENAASGVTLKGFTVNSVMSYDDATKTWSSVNITETKFNTDSYAYRMAKMLHECEDYLVMDSIVYHYLFIQRHTMVDNVAKNTFWSTEDGIHWDLTKDYDNDTADGNNNSGNLVFGYGLEIFDTNQVENEAVSIFNAPQSVWLRFIYGLPTVQKKLYKLISAKSSDAWGSQKYLKAFEEHQNIIPERCWIQNYFHHYIRPRRIGLDGSDKFLKRLEGGKKTHQRKQYETYQGFYIDSKYVTGDNFQTTGSLDMRLNNSANGSWNEDTVIPLKYYVDCYGSALIGGAEFQSQRLKKGEFYNCPVGKVLANPQDSTAYFYGANMIQVVNDLSPAYPQSVGLDSARKLKEIIIGSGEEGYRNPFLDTLGTRANTMLTKMDIQNVGIEAGLNLELPAATQLKELYMSGSTVKSLTLPENGILETLQLNQKLGAIVASNLLNIKNFSVDSGYEQYLTSVKVSNCPALNDYTYNFAVKEGFSAEGVALVKSYAITDFNWTVTKIEDLVLENEKVVDIIALKNLAKGISINSNKTTDLIGTILIDVECTIDEYALYEKYASTYPNVIIEFSEKVTLDPAAATIVFYNDKEGDSIYYQVKGPTTEGNLKTLEFLISAEGPLKMELITPFKASTNAYTYTFLGWKNRQNDADVDLKAVVSSSLELYPVFEQKDKAYTIEFYDNNNVLIPELTLTKLWTQTYSVPGYVYRDDTNLPEDKTWAFLGWAETNYGDDTTAKDLITSTQSLTTTGNKKYYAHFKKQDVREQSTDISYFNFDTKDQAISIKEEYRNYKGKLTIPSTYNGKDVLVVGDFSNMPNLTHVYFQEGSQCTTIGTGAFAWHGDPTATKFVKIELPEKIKTISSNAFYHCASLRDVGENFYKVTYIGDNAFSGGAGEGFTEWYDMALELNELPADLIYLGQGAFYKCVNIKVTKIPVNITALLSFTFVDCINVSLSDFKGITEIGTMALYTIENEKIDTIDIRDIEVIDNIGSSAFEAAYINLKTVIYNSKISEEDIAKVLGFEQVETFQAMDE